VRLILCLVTVIFIGPLSVYVLCIYHKYLDGPSRTTILLYLICIIINLAYSVYYYWGDNHHDKSILLVEVPVKIVEFAIIAIFYYFIYELRILRYKLESQDAMDLYLGLRKSKLYFKLIISTLFIIMVLDILAG